MLMSPTAVVTEEIVDFCLTRGGTLLDELAVNGSYCLNGEAFGKQAVTYMLVELPMHFLTQYADDFWYELRLKGVAPILAHPERYPELMAHTERLLKWCREGLLLQCRKLCRKVWRERAERGEAAFT